MDDSDPKYLVMIGAKNLDWLSPEERVDDMRIAEFETREIAVKFTKKWIDRELSNIVGLFKEGEIKEALNAPNLLAKYKEWGNDPFILCRGKMTRFSGLEYAEERCFHMEKLRRFK